MSGVTTGPPARTARAATFAAVCVTTTALGHALMSGTLPWWALVAAFLATGSAAYCLTGRQRGVLVVAGSTVAAQLGLHALFGLAQASASSATLRVAPTTSMSGISGMDMGPMAPTHALSHAGPGGPGMFLAHLLAALVCGLWLWRGEAAAFRLARSLAGLLFAPLLLVGATHGRSELPLPERRLIATPLLKPHAVLWHDVVSRRGPPQPSLCC
ncbi:hypothetical protein ACWCXK_03840 [Streptomyces sp. NPDC001739]|uniref:hypothetical protein n=1 Tax=Streptomyces sp. NPDC001633 TaxID=3364595 RepID=UPI0036C6AAA7